MYQRDDRKADKNHVQDIDDMIFGSDAAETTVSDR